MGRAFRLRFLVLLLLCICLTGLFLASSWTFSVTWHSVWKSRICACRTCLLEGQSCFTELVNEAPNPFMSKNHRISEEEFLWWKPIQGTKTNFTVYNSSVEQVFKTFPKFPELLGPSPVHCRSCAVVGNSGNLKGSRYGPLIDYHNIVIRVNRGRTEGFEADVGTKTTHRVVYPESFTKVDKSTYLLFFPFKTPDFQWLLNQVRPDENGVVKTNVIANKDLVLILSPAYIKYVHAAWLGKKGAYPSTGFLAFVLSLSFCDEVSVFGFGANEDGNWDHYFEILRDKKLKTGGHPGQYEYEVIEKLHKKKNIQFYKGQ